MKKSLNKTIFLFCTCLLLTFNFFGITRVAVGSGNWASGSTWSPSGIPACGDSVYIAAGYTVDFNNQQNYSSCSTPIKIVIDGTISFHQGTKIRLPCGSVVRVNSGGSILHDQGLANSNFIEICGQVTWNSNCPNPTYGAFTMPPMAPGCGTLPVELLNFTAGKCNEGKMCLDWETATESNNDHYEVERSADAIEFSTVMIVKSKAPGGQSEQKISYRAIDERPLEGTNYYRLNQIDKDHKNIYSKVITVQMSTGLQFSIFPNSNSGEFTAQITGLDRSENVSVLLRNSSGAIVYKALHFIDKEHAQVKVVPGLKLPTGFYFCSFIIGESEHIVKVIVTNL